jgi:hypothetical protein
MAPSTNPSQPPTSASERVRHPLGVVQKHSGVGAGLRTLRTEGSDAKPHDGDVGARFPSQHLGHGVSGGNVKEDRWNLLGPDLGSEIRDVSGSWRGKRAGAGYKGAEDLEVVALGELPEGVVVGH